MARWGWLGTILGPWILRKLGVNYPQRPVIELIEGDGVEIDVEDDPATEATKVTISASGGGDGPEIPAGNANDVVGLDGAGGLKNLGPMPPPGEANTTSNVGSGEGELALPKSGVNLPFRTLKAGSNVTISTGTNEVTISASGGGGGPSVSGSGLATVTGGSFDPNALAWGSANTVLVSSGSGGTFVQITNAHVASNAAIAVTKLAPGSANTVLTSNGSSNSFVQITNAHVANNAGITVTKLAAGSANTVLTTNGSGTITWDAISLNSSMTTGTLPINKGGTGVTALPGSTGNPLINSSGALGAASNWTIGTGFMGGSGSFISLGGGTPASSGYVRVPYNGGVSTLVVVGRTSGGSDAAAITWGSGDAWTFGSTLTDWHARGVVGSMTLSSTLTINATSTITLQRAGALKIELSSFGTKIQDGSSSIDVMNNAIYAAAGGANGFYLTSRGLSLFENAEMIGSGSTNVIYLAQGSASGNPSGGIYIWFEGELLKARLPNGITKTFAWS
jgi:hypothetical protein